MSARDRGGDLYALLLGLPPYQRPEAPEPALLAELADELDGRALRRALDIAGTARVWAGTPELRAAVLRNLAIRVSQLGEADRLALLGALRNPAALAPYLPPSLALELLDHLHGLERPADSARILGSLAQGGPANADQLAEEALRTAHGVPERERYADTLVELAARLPAPWREAACREALQALREAPRPKFAVARLTRLLPELPAPLRDEAAAYALDAANRLPPADYAFVLGRLARYLPPTGARELTDAVDHAQALPPAVRAVTLARLAPRLPHGLDEEVSVAALEAARTAGHAPARALAAARVAAELTGPIADSAVEEAIAESRLVSGAHSLQRLAEALSHTSPAAVARLPRDTRTPEIGRHARETLPGLPEGERAALMAGVVREMADRWVGPRRAALRERKAPKPKPTRGMRELDAKPGHPAVPDEAILDEAMADEAEVAHAIAPEGVEAVDLELGVDELDELAELDRLEEAAELAPDETPERVVNTGFADLRDPGDPLRPDMPLEPGRRYWFWLDVGEPVRHSVETTPADVPAEFLPESALLTVAVFGFPDELQPARGQDLGELQLAHGGGVPVTKPAAVPEGMTKGQGLLSTRLFFGVETADTEGAQRLRCNIYCRGTLVQSRLIRALVRTQPVPQPRALRSDLEYTLSRSIDSAQLASMAPTDLSIMVNGDEKQHQFRLLASDNEKVLFKEDSEPLAHALQDQLERARAALRLVSWGDEQDWQEEDGVEKYLYAKSPDADQFRRDVAVLAKRGNAVYTALRDALSGGPERAGDLEDHARRPGYVQIAATDPKLFVPAALFYDYLPFDPRLEPDEYTLCPDFEEALDGDEELESSPCFQGDCPSRGQDTVVCPSGFWGFRHRIGWPVTTRLDAPPTIPNATRLMLAFGTALNLDLWEDHWTAIRELREHWRDARSVDDLMALLNEQPHLLYLYCHGSGEADPYLQLGEGGRRNLLNSGYMANRVRWKEPRPLVFINGCKTTALEPERAVALVDAFIRWGASGVIGTEITVFEQLATEFGREFLKRFLAEGQDVGNAVRGARLVLLKRRNPLGLVYVPFVMPGVRLEPPRMAA